MNNQNAQHLFSGKKNNEVLNKNEICPPINKAEMVEMSKTEKDIGHHPRSHSVSEDNLHQSSVSDKRNEHDNKHATMAGTNLASLNVDHGNNGKTTNHMAGSISTDTECAITVSRDVICTKKILKFSQPRENGTNMENAMTSGFGENYLSDTGLEVGIGCKIFNSTDGNLDVNPSTYPTGCPNNYFLLLNKTNTQS